MAAAAERVLGGGGRQGSWRRPARRSARTGAGIRLPRSPRKRSPHAVVTGQWNPTPADNAAGRAPGYGLTGGVHCAGGNGGAYVGVGYYVVNVCDSCEVVL